MPVRAVRGATQLDVDERDHLLERVVELVSAVMQCNAISEDDLISILFTATPDVHSEFPAYAARRMGLVDVPLMSAVELDVESSMPRVIRLMAHVHTTLARADVTHVYLHGATNLRRDLTHVYAAPNRDQLLGG